MKEPLIQRKCCVIEKRSFQAEDYVTDMLAKRMIERI